MTELKTSTDAVGTLGELIQSCKKTEKAFRQAAQSITDVELRRLFDTYAKQRVRFSTQLEVEVARLGGILDLQGGSSRMDHVGKPRTKSAACGEPNVIAACAGVEDECVRAYEKAFLADLTPPLHTVVERQRAAVIAAADRVHDLQARYRTVA